MSDDKAANETDLLGDAKASDGAVLSVDGLLDMCGALAASGATDEGWVYSRCPSLCRLRALCSLLLALLTHLTVSPGSGDRPRECAQTFRSWANV